MISDRQYRALLRQECRAASITLSVLGAVTAAQTAICVTAWRTPWWWAHLVVTLALYAVLPMVAQERRRLCRAIEDLHDA